jgi:hypothetical protein
MKSGAAQTFEPLSAKRQALRALHKYDLALHYIRCDEQQEIMKLMDLIQ